jgi:hypothetical protein
LWLSGWVHLFIISSDRHSEKQQQQQQQQQQYTSRLPVFDQSSIGATLHAS